MVTYPKEWEFVNLSSIGKIVTGSTPATNNKNYWGKEYTWITPTDIDGRVLMNSSERKLSKEGFEVSRQLPQGSILVTCIASIGKNCILDSVGSCNQQINAIVPSGEYDSFFIYYLMQFSKDTLENLAGITATKILNKKTFENIQFHIPKLPEQQAIASILCGLDEYIDNLSELIEKKKAISDGAMEDLISGKTRLEGFSEEWESLTIDDFIKIKRGASPRPIESYITKNSNGINWIKIGDAPRYGKYIESTKERITQSGANHSVMVYPDDFLLSNSMSFGRPYILKVKGCIHDGWLRLYDFQEKADKDFLFYLLSTQNVQSQYMEAAAGSGVQNLNKEVVKRVKVVLPPLIEQKAIASVLAAMYEEAELFETEKAKMIQIREGAMDDLLTGRVRLKV